MLRLIGRLPIVNRLAHLFWRLSRGMTLGVRGVIIDDDGRVFLIRHSYADGWHLPGGGVEPGETLIEALARELREEGGIQSLEPPVLHGIFYHPMHSNRDHVAVYVVRAFRQGAPSASAYEISASGFFAPDALPEDTTSGTRARITEVLDGLPAADCW